MKSVTNGETSVTFAVDVVFCVPTLEAGSTAGHVLRKPVAQWNSLQQASTLKVGESHFSLAKNRLRHFLCSFRDDRYALLEETFLVYVV